MFYAPVPAPSFIELIQGKSCRHRLPVTESARLDGSCLVTLHGLFENIENLHICARIFIFDMLFYLGAKFSALPLEIRRFHGIMPIDIPLERFKPHFFHAFAIRIQSPKGNLAIQFKRGDE